MTPDRFLKLKKQVNELEKQFHATQGSRDTLLTRLQEEFECESLDDAQDQLAKLERRRGNLDRQRQKKLKDFEMKWKEQLDGTNS